LLKLLMSSNCMICLVAALHSSSLDCYFPHVDCSKRGWT
jgi:hypothetical protein